MTCAVTGVQGAQQIAGRDPVTRGHDGVDGLDGHEEVAGANRHDGSIDDDAREVDDTRSDGAHTDRVAGGREVDPAMPRAVGARWSEELAHDDARALDGPDPRRPARSRPARGRRRVCGRDGGTERERREEAMEDRGSRAEGGEVHAGRMASPRASGPAPSAVGGQL